MQFELKVKDQFIKICSNNVNNSSSGQVYKIAKQYFGIALSLIFNLNYKLKIRKGQYEEI